MATAVKTSAPADLKRLGFVHEYSGYYWNKSGQLASQAYAAGKQYAPKSLVPRIDAVETKVSQYSSPALATLQDRSGSVLKSLDSSVDFALVKANGYYSDASGTASAVHKDNMARFHSSRQAYFDKVQEAVEYVKSHGLTGTAKSAADALLVQVEGAKKIPAAVEKQAAYATEKVKEAWTNFVSLPAVQKVTANTNAATNFAWDKYLSAHDAVLGHPAYHRAVKAGSDSVGTLQGTSVYKTLASRVYPSVAPYADPALDRIQGNSYYKAAVGHLKPVSANGKLS